MEAELRILSSAGPQAADHSRRRAQPLGRRAARSGDIRRSTTTSTSRSSTTISRHRRSQAAAGNAGRGHRSDGLAYGARVHARADLRIVASRHAREIEREFAGSQRSWGQDGSTDSVRRARHAPARGDRVQAEADGRGRRPADPLAHHDALPPSRRRPLRALPRLQGRRHPRLLHQLPSPLARHRDRRRQRRDLDAPRRRTPTGSTRASCWPRRASTASPAGAS